MREVFKVKFGEVARTLDCEDAQGHITFTLDLGSRDNKSLCLEHHPLDWPRGPRYDDAFQSAKGFLESCGYEVEVFGD